MPPAVRRLRHVLPVTGSSAPGAPSSRGQASFAIRTRQSRPEITTTHSLGFGLVQLAIASPAASRLRRSFRSRQAPSVAPMPATNTRCVGSGTEIAVKLALAL